MLFLLLACSPSDDADDTAGGPVYDPNPVTVLGGDRPAAVVLPANYSIDREWPVVVLLHGYGATADLQDVIFGLAARVDDLGFILVKPEGLVDSSGSQYWNATEECCDFDHSGVDDVGYLTGLLDEAKTVYPVASEALVGHSNGGYMSYRMACEVPDRLARIVVLAGAVYKDESDCVGQEPVPVLHVHGTADDSVPYESDPNHAGAEESVGRWVTKAGCDPTPADGGTRDYLSAIDGDETSVEQWSGCADGIDIQLWTAHDGDHIFLDNRDAFKDDAAAWAILPR